MQQALADPRVQAVVVDLAGVTFLDSSALGVLVAGRKAAELRSRSFTVTNPGPMVAMVLRVTGPYDVLVADGPGLTAAGRPLWRDKCPVVVGGPCRLAAWPN